MFVSQTFLSERTQVFWLNKILLTTCFHGYRACSVSRSAILKFECNLGLIALESMGVNVLHQVSYMIMGVIYLLCMWSEVLKDL